MSPKVEMGYSLHFLSSDCLCDYAIFMRSLIFCLESLMFLKLQQQTPGVST